MWKTSLAYGLIILATYITALPTAGAQPVCSNATMNGKYVLSGHGKNFILDVAGVAFAQHVEEVGYLTADGNGQIAARIIRTTENRTNAAYYTGTYTLNGDCQGQLALTSYPNGNEAPAFAILASGFDGTGTAARFMAEETDGNAEVILGAARSEDPAGGCTQNLLAGVTMAESGAGGTGNQDASAILELTFNADGTVTGNGTETSDGVKSPLTINGTYAVSSDCSVTVSQPGLPDGNFQLVVAPVPGSAAKLKASSPSDSGASGAAVGSPGVISGNVIQVPIQIPINLCGNSIDIVGLLNPTFGNTCVNG